jgi:WD40 repeat protein
VMTVDPDDCGTHFATALSRPAIAADGRHIALVTPQQELQLLRVVDNDHTKIIHQGPVPQLSKSPTSHLTVLKWSSESDGSDDCPWLLLSDGSRLIVANPQIWIANTRTGLNANVNSAVVADYDLGDHFGKLLFADFVLGQSKVLTLFEANGSAVFLSTTKSSRQEVPTVKYTGPRSIARSSDNRSLALMQRVKGADQVVLFGVNQDDLLVQSCFVLPTYDAAGIMFSPSSDPVLVAWDSPSYGVKVYFFSSMGHRLTQLDVVGFGKSSGLDGVGVSKLCWYSTSDSTVLAVADGHKQVLVRRQKKRSADSDQLGVLIHPPVIDGMQSIVWQQTSVDDFALQKGAFDAVVEPAASGDVALLELSADQSFLSSVSADNPKTVWLWQPEHSEPHTIIVFQDQVRQLLWHPKQKDILLVVTANKLAKTFVWYTETRPPAACNIDQDIAESTKFEGIWLPRVACKNAFALTSTTGINMGVMREREGKVLFSSILHQSRFDLEDSGMDETEMQTPSKPSKRKYQEIDEEAW